MSTREHAAARVVRAGEGRSVRWGPRGRVRVVASADATDGAFSMVEATEPPGSAAPLHVHHREAEAFFVLDGAIELTCGEQTVAARTGDFVYTPKGVAHKYTVVGDRAARILLFFSRPGFESFFLDGGSPVDQPPAGPPDPERMQQLFAKYDLDVLEAMPH